MDPSQYMDLLLMLKALADEQRLKLVGMTGQREWSVTEIAEELKLAESTVSYHVAKLHQVGLLNLRMDGTFRYYRLNPKRLAAFKRLIDVIDTPLTPHADETNDLAWIDALDLDEEDKKVLRGYTHNGKLKQFPTKDRKWLAVMRWLAGMFEPETRYTEKQVNEILQAVNPDYATLRRSLVEYGFMRRERGGGDYWLAPADEMAH
ncbi:MAG TPA: metalloregulator ArsR/SmtB family transcription factor [Aggregatilineales bacterium]|jgi:predicted DNA-binding transcriptional regulator|nr:metalloregulator ArsR/SmtB family transcription factor [Aggregatilineales bacterium]